MRSEEGQSLIEVLIALAAAVAIIAAIATSVITSLSNVEYTKNQNLATQYSREGLEVMRQNAKDNWTNFSSYSGNYCLDQARSLTSMVINCGQNVGIFVRQITINQNSSACSNNTKVTSTVFWSDSKCVAGNSFCHTVNLETCLANINTVQVP